MELYYWNETKDRMQTVSDFSHPGKFIFKKNFPFEFYSYVDGKKDITFNIYFSELKFNDSSGQNNHSFEIIGYIVDDTEIDNLKYDKNYLPTESGFKGYYDDKLKMGKLIIKKEEISKSLKINAHNNYLYIIINNTNSKMIYNNVNGQFLFFSMDYVYSAIPEDFYIFSNLETVQKTPHLYTIKMDKGKDILIEFETSGNELDCKILNYQKYVDGKSDLYEDYDKYNIKRNFSNNKRYIKVIQSKNETEEINNIILSIFSKNVDHIAGPNISNLSYIIKYNSSLSNNYDENYAENSTENITEDTSEAPTKTKTTTTLLGFANFVYIKEIKIVHFIVYFSSKTKIIYSEILIFSINIIYKRSLRGLDEDNKKIQCNLID